MSEQTSATLTIEQVITAVREVAAETPDLHYRRYGRPDFCLYTEGAYDDGGGCIIGRALMRLGVPEERLSAVGGLAVAHVLGRLGIHVAPISRAWLTCVQDLQDSGFSFSQAVERADAEADERIAWTCHE